MKLKKIISNLTPLAVILYTPVMVMTLGSLVLFAVYNVPYADDYDSILWMSLENNGITVSFNHFLERITHTTRPAQEFVAHTFYALLGDKTPELLPLIAMGLFVLTCYLFLKRTSFINQLHRFRAATALSLSILILLCTLYFSASPYPNGALFAYQLFYFPSSTVTYLIPLLLALLLFYLFSLSSKTNSLNHWCWKIIYIIFMTFLFTSNETVAPTLLVIALSILLVLGFALAIRKVRPMKLKPLITHPVSLTLGSALLSILISLPLKSTRINQTRWGDYSLASNVFKSIVEAFDMFGHVILRPIDIMLAAVIGILTIAVLQVLHTDSKVNYASLFRVGLILLLSTIAATYSYRFLQNMAYGFTLHDLPRAAFMVQILSAAAAVTVLTGIAGIIMTPQNTQGNIVRASLITASILVLPLFTQKTTTSITNQLEASISNHTRWHDRKNAIDKAVHEGKNTVYLEDTQDGVTDTYTLYCSPAKIPPDWKWYNNAVQSYYGGSVKLCNKIEADN